MDHDSYSRSPNSSQRPANRDRDDRRGSDPYRDSRRRSPDRRRDRRRSRSPTQIDRYQPDRLPRDDYYSSRGRDDGHRERRRSSPQPSNIDRWVPGMEDAGPPKIVANPLPDPLKLEYQVGFTWFAEWWRQEQRVKEEKERLRTGKPPPRVKGERESREDRDADRPKIQAAYDEYKEKLQKSQAQTFVRLHKGEDWFRERYVPEARDPFRRRLMDYRQGLFAQWEQELSSGTFDEFTLEGIYKSESNGLGGILEKEEGEASAAAEVLMPGDLVPTKGGDIRDPAAEQPTLLIKTVAPTVNREKLEAFAKELLGEGEGGFDHLSLSDPNPLKRCHRMGWILLHPGSPQEEVVEDVVKREDEEEGEANGDAMKAEHTTRMPSTTTKALEKINGKTVEDPERGNFTVHCGVHRPPDAPRKKALWDLFSAPERIARDLDLAIRLVRKLDNELGDDYFGVAKIEERVQSLAERGLLQPAEKDKTIKDTDMDMEDGEDADEDEGMIDEDETDDEDLLIKKKKLDLLVEYLRRVYSFCFFCVFESDAVHELQRKCPGGHLRRPRNSLTSTAKEVARASALGEAFPLKKNAGKGDGRDANNGIDTIADDGYMALDAESPTEEKKFTALKPSTRTAQQLQRAFNWVKTYEEKILQLLEPENVNIRKLGGVPVDEGVEEELSKFVLQEDTNKYRCKAPECTKLFKGLEFWRKHVEKRHAEFFERVRADIELVNTYVLDPAHIIPSRSDANSNGHFPLGGGMMASTPRNFQLNQHLPMGFGAAAAIPNALNPVFGAMGMGFNPSMNMAALPGLPVGIGPMRSQGRNMMNGRYAPYDTKRRAPSMSGGRPGGVPAFPGMTGAFGEGGSGAMGPPEATLNRSLKSYEDLDAADKGQGTTELDY